MVHAMVESAFVAPAGLVMIARLVRSSSSLSNRLSPFFLVLSLSCLFFFAADRQVTLGQAVTDTLSQFQWKYYHVAVPSSGSGLSFSLNQTATGTDCDIYIQKDDFPTFSSYVARDISMNAVVTINIPVRSFFFPLPSSSAC